MSHTKQSLSQFHIIRFDRLVEDFVTTNNVSLWQHMNTDFPIETRTLIEDVLHLGKIEDEGIENTLRTYYADSTLCNVRYDAARKFENISPIERKLGKAFQNLSHQLPDFVIPKVYTQNSALSESIIVGDSLIGISLDKYMGADYPVYKKYFYDNQRVTMEPSRIVQDCLTFYLNHIYRPKRQPNTHLNLLECMIHQGKIHWVVAQLTNSRLSDIAAVQPTTKQWYKLNERNVWKELKKRNLTHTTDFRIIHAVMFIGDAHPFFNDIHSRGIGLWVGMRIVDSYMKYHPQVSLGQLLEDNDYEKILQQSHYDL